MIYLEFSGTRSEQPIFERVICCTDYAVTRGEDDGLVVHHHPGEYDVVSRDCFLNCYVMSETGKTIDKLEAP